MRKHLPYSLLLLTGLISCQRNNPDGPDPFTQERIQVLAEAPASKAILDGTAAMDHNGTRSTIYDYLSNFEGTIKVPGSEEHTYTASESFKYFSDEISYPGGAGAWTYTSGNSYRWTRTGTHTFFGWMVQDGDSGLTTQGTFGTPSFDESTRVLTLPAYTLSPSGSQYDFLYSETREVEAAEAGTSPVPLQYKHLFSALKIEVQNASDNVYVVQSVQSAFIYNTKSASIDFANGTVSYSNTGQANFVPSFSEKTLAAKTDSAPGGSFSLWNNYTLMWPQTPSEIQSAKLLVTFYLQDDPDDVQTAVIELKNVRVGGSYLRDTGLEAGKKYSFLLQFKNSAIDLDISVNDWIFTETEINFSETTIAAKSDAPYDGILWLFHQDGTTITKDEDRKITMLNSQETIKGRFYIASPYIGRWQVSIFPMDAAQYFVIEPNSGDITRDLVENHDGLVEFSIRANPAVAAPTSVQTAHFNVSIYFGNDWHDAISEFNRKDFRLVRNPN